MFVFYHIFRWFHEILGKVEQRRGWRWKGRGIEHLFIQLSKVSKSYRLYVPKMQKMLLRTNKSIKCQSAVQSENMHRNLINIHLFVVVWRGSLNRVYCARYQFHQQTFNRMFRFYCSMQLFPVEKAHKKVIKSTEENAETHRVHGFVVHFLLMKIIWVHNRHWLNSTMFIKWLKWGQL